MKIATQRRGKVLGIAAAAAVITAGVAATALAVTAPPASQGCGIKGGDDSYSNCVVLLNNSQGFSAPAKATAANGPEFRGVSLTPDGYNVQYVWDRGNYLENPDGWISRDRWGGMRCWHPYDGWWLMGCGGSAKWDYAAAQYVNGVGSASDIAGQKTLQTELRKVDSTQLGASAEVTYNAGLAGGTTRASCTSTRFVECTQLFGGGNDKHVRFVYDLTDRTVVVHIENRVDQTLEHTTGPLLGRMVEDVRGTHGLAKIAPFTGGEPGQAYLGALREWAFPSSAVFNYRLVATEGSPNSYTGTGISIDVRLKADGDNNDSVCTVHQVGYTKPTCELHVSPGNGSQPTVVTVNLRA